MKPTSLTGAALLTFDHFSAYYDSSYGDSIPLLVTDGDKSSTGFKFWYYTDNTLAATAYRECTGTANAIFIALVQKYLFLKIGTDYKMCVFSP